MKPQRYFIAGLLACSFAPAMQAAQTQTIGWIEHVQILPQDIMLKAKIDTGADNSSIHADDIAVFEKDGSKRVKFTVENKKGEKATFDLPLIRYATIKRKLTDPIKRPVVSMELCIGNILKKVHINLANRGNFKYRMLIGRSYLKELYLVDSGKRYTSEPNCKGSIAHAQHPA